MKIGGVPKIKETSPDIVGTELFWTVNNLKQSRYIYMCVSVCIFYVITIFYIFSSSLSIDVPTDN